MARPGARREVPPDDPRHLRVLIELLVPVLVPRDGPPLDWCPDAVVDTVATAPRPDRLGVGHIKRIVDALSAPDIRRRCAELVDLDRLDERCRRWLANEPEWWGRAGSSDTESDDDRGSDDDPSALRREVRRRHAAEQKAARAEEALTRERAETTDLRDRIAELESALDKSAAEQDALHESLRSARMDLRHERDRHAATTARLERATEQAGIADAAAQEAEEVRDRVLEERRDLLGNIEHLSDMVKGAETLLAGLRSMLPPPREGDRREPVRVPGAYTGLPDRAADHLMRCGATVIVDAYNVTLGRLGHLDIAEQRERLLSGCEQLAARTGADIVVAIDGANIVGAHAPARRHVRVLYSPEGVDADDTIREELGRVPVSRPVVVVTDDRAIRTDARALGANLVDSPVFADLLWGR